MTVPDNQGMLNFLAEVTEGGFKHLRDSTPEDQRPGDKIVQYCLVSAALITEYGIKIWDKCPENRSFKALAFWNVKTGRCYRGLILNGNREPLWHYQIPFEDTTSPRYDEVFFRGVSALDEDEEY